MTDKITFEEAKNIIAKNYGHDSFPKRFLDTAVLGSKILHEAAELYASSERKRVWEEAIKAWECRPVDVKSGWKNNSKVLSEIVSAMNNEKYVEDENEMMEYIDLALEFIKEKYFKP